MSPDGEAVLHTGGADLPAMLGPLLRAALDRGADVLLSCGEARTAQLRTAAGDHHRLRTLPPQPVWRRPTASLTLLLELAEDAAAAGRELLIVSDSQHGPGPVDWSEWARFEAASHVVTAGYPVRRFCLVDLARAPEPVLAAAGRLHPVVHRGGSVGPSPAYADVAGSVARDGYVAADPLEAGPPLLDLDGITRPDDLPRTRHALAAEVARHGLPEWRAYELVLAAGEIVANAVRHGRPPARVLVWATRDRLLCTVTDLGPGFDFPLSTYLAPEPAGHGLGLFLARQLVDQMNVRWTPQGFTVRLGLFLGDEAP